jgi:hypothetical protein
MLRQQKQSAAPISHCNFFSFSFSSSVANESHVTFSQSNTVTTFASIERKKTAFGCCIMCILLFTWYLFSATFCENLFRFLCELGYNGFFFSPVPGFLIFPLLLRCFLQQEFCYWVGKE